MTNEEFHIACSDMIYLAGCVVNNKTPDHERTENMNMDHLFQVSECHMLSAIVYLGLKSAGIFNDSFHQEWAKSVHKLTVMDIDKVMLFQELEKEKIWYMPLKGTVIKDLYPSFGLRQMSDFDILTDKNYSGKVHDIMLKLGFTCEYYEDEAHDVYFKQPVSNFEIHKALYRKRHKEGIYNYYRDISSHLIKDDNNQYGYHFSNEDLYVYLTAHEYKHYTNGGTGIRSVLDTYVFLQKLGDSLDIDYIKAETDKMGISDFEQNNRSLALHLFGDGQLTETERETLEYISLSGTFGTLQNTIKNNAGKYGNIKKSKMAYIMKKLFIPLEEVKLFYPFYYKHKILLPLLFFYRIGKALTVSRKKTGRQLTALKKIK